MDLKKILGAVALTVTATAALATPQYTGNTEGMPTFDEVGYYIWNEGTTWNIYMHDPHPWGLGLWEGSLTVTNTGIDGAPEKFDFDSNDGITALETTELPSSDVITWKALTGELVGSGSKGDGISFTVKPGFERISLLLHTLHFDGMGGSTVGSVITGNKVFVGKDKTKPEVLFTRDDDLDNFQSFDIFGPVSVEVPVPVPVPVSVPEPATIALFGLGLAGLAASRRRNKNVVA